MEPVAVYRRRIRASLARIWENVLDWEHLPWLHSTSFAGIELLESSREGWRAWVTLPGAGGARALIDVQLQREALHYFARTVEGAAAGTEIRTTLAPLSRGETDIRVEFFVPGVDPEWVDRVGAVYTSLYTRLWDEDEAMMVRRQELLDAGPRGARTGEVVQLGPVADLRPRLPLVLDAESGAVRIVELDGEIVAHAAVCPHLGGPLAQAEVCAGVLTCPWHGYRFTVRSGTSADGRRLRLAPAPRVEIDAAGAARLVW